MRALFIRHAIAEDRERFAATGKSDDFRPLTPKGRDKMQRAAAGLRQIVPELEVLAASPLTRAVQTAEIIAEAYPGMNIVERDELAPAAAPKKLLRWLQKQSAGPVAMVGHEPHLSSTVSWLLTGSDEPLMEFKKGAACLVEFPGTVDACEAALLWSLRSDHLRRLGA